MIFGSRNQPFWKQKRINYDRCTLDAPAVIKMVMTGTANYRKHLTGRMDGDQELLAVVRNIDNSAAPVVYVKGTINGVSDCSLNVETKELVCFKPDKKGETMSLYEDTPFTANMLRSWTSFAKNPFGYLRRSAVRSAMTTSSPKTVLGIISTILQPEILSDSL